MNIKKIDKNIFEIEKSGKMNVNVKIFASENLLEIMKRDKCLEQMKNVSMLPGIIKEAIILPDAHQGYGFSIGGVAAFDINKGVISPGGVGYDINCSVRIINTNLRKEDIEKKKESIAKRLHKAIPFGIGEGGKLKITNKELDEILEKGAEWAVERGFGSKDDYLNSEENGRMKEANCKYVSERAKLRGINQLGSVGSGNHFLEIQYVEKILKKEIAKVFNLYEGSITIMIHCGSRGLGHQVASDYIKLMEEEYGFKELPDRELINAPINSELGKKYYGAMCCAANFAFCNKQILTHFIREEIEKEFPNLKAEVLYDVCHNIAKFEDIEVDGRRVKACIHRKGATRSLGPENKMLPERYKETGQPIIIPGSMGTSSYIMVGTKRAEEISLSSTAHGAGRLMSRNFAINNLNGKRIIREIEEKGIIVKTNSIKSIVEESPEAYKDVDEVVRVSDEVGIGKIVAKLKPLIVIKG
ncbi:MAG: RtcB family protein [Candidatus Pacearchaeota archaeon]